MKCRESVGATPRPEISAFSAPRAFEGAPRRSHPLLVGLFATSLYVGASIATAANVAAINPHREPEGVPVALTLAAPAMALTGSAAPYTDFVDYASTLGNSDSITSQAVHYLFSVVRIDAGNSGDDDPLPIAADDVQVCLFDPSGWAAQEPGNHHACPQDYQSLFFSQVAGSLNGRPATVFRYPIDPANDLRLPLMPVTALPPTKFQFGSGEYRVQVDVVGADNQTVYATAAAGTSLPEASIRYNGATSGSTGTALLSTTTLSNRGGRVVGNVIVRISLSDAAATPGSPIALNPDDAEFAYHDGAGYATPRWSGTTSDGGLVTMFGPPAGFELSDGYIAATASRATFHRFGTYRLVHEIVDVATGDVVHASEEKNLVIAVDQLSFGLSDLNQIYDGTPRRVTVSPAGLPHTLVYEPLRGTSCPARARGSNTIAPTAAGSYCVYVDAKGSAGGAASGTLVVVKAILPVSLDGAIGGAVSRVCDATPQVVAATTPASLSDAISVTYDGSDSAPTTAGSYRLRATIVDPNYQGSTNGTLTVSTAGGVANLDGVAGDRKIHRDCGGASVAALTASTKPSGTAISVHADVNRIGASLEFPALDMHLSSGRLSY